MFIFFWCLFLVEFGSAATDNVVAAESGGEESEDEWNYIGTDQEKGHDKDKKATIVEEHSEHIELIETPVEQKEQESQVVIPDTPETEIVSCILNFALIWLISRTWKYLNRSNSTLKFKLYFLGIYCGARN